MISDDCISWLQSMALAGFFSVRVLEQCTSLKWSCLSIGKWANYLTLNRQVGGLCPSKCCQINNLWPSIVAHRLDTMRDSILLSECSFARRTLCESGRLSAAAVPLGHRSSWHSCGAKRECILARAAAVALAASALRRGASPSASLRNVFAGSRH